MFIYFRYILRWFRCRFTGSLCQCERYRFNFNTLPSLSLRVCAASFRTCGFISFDIFKAHNIHRSTTNCSHKHKQIIMHTSKHTRTRKLKWSRCVFPAIPWHSQLSAKSNRTMNMLYGGFPGKLSIVVVVWCRLKVKIKVTRCGRFRSIPLCRWFEHFQSLARSG